MKKWIAIICCISLFAIPLSGFASEFVPKFYGVNFNGWTIDNDLDYSQELRYELDTDARFPNNYPYRFVSGIFPLYRYYSENSSKPAYSSLGLPNYQNSGGYIYSDIDLRGYNIVVGISYDSALGPPAPTPTLSIYGVNNSSQYFTHVRNYDAYAEKEELSYLNSYVTYNTRYHVYTVSKDAPNGIFKVSITNISGTSEWFNSTSNYTIVQHQGYSDQYMWTYWLKYSISYVNAYITNAEGIDTSGADSLLNDLNSVNKPNVTNIQDPIDLVPSGSLSNVSLILGNITGNSFIVTLMLIVIGLAIGSYFLFGRKT